jgi:acyl-CoA thioesterase I
MKPMESMDKRRPVLTAQPKRRRLLSHVFAMALASATLLPGCASVRTPSVGGNTILVVGDSLSAGYGLQPGTGWAWLLEPRLSAEHFKARVINVSVSGETTVTGRAKIEGLVNQHKPTIVVIELGADDTFSGMPLSTTQSNLSFMIRTAQQVGAQILLISVRVPSRYGPTYEADFERVFGDLAESSGSALVPNLLDRVSNAPDAKQLFQRDNVHPNEQGQPILLANVWSELRKLLK